MMNFCLEQTVYSFVHLRKKVICNVHNTTLIKILWCQRGEIDFIYGMRKNLVRGQILAKIYWGDIPIGFWPTLDNKKKEMVMSQKMNRI